MATIVEFRLEDGKVVKVFGKEEMSDEATVDKLLTLEVGDTIYLEATGERREYKILGMERQHLFPLKTGAEESIASVTFTVKLTSETKTG